MATVMASDKLKEQPNISRNTLKKLRLNYPGAIKSSVATDACFYTAGAAFDYRKIIEI
jgi:hypothetical protein